MNLARIRAIVRQFSENGIKLLLHQPESARELYQLAGFRLLDRLDFAAMQVDPTS